VKARKQQKANPRKHGHSWASAELFPGGTTLTFWFSFSNCWRSVFPLRLCIEQIFVLMSMITLGLSRWNFQWITNFVNNIINIQSYQNTNNMTFHSNSFLFACFSIALECWKCARMRFQLTQYAICRFSDF